MYVYSCAWVLNLDLLLLLFPLPRKMPSEWRRDWEEEGEKWTKTAGLLQQWSFLLMVIPEEQPEILYKDNFWRLKYLWNMCASQGVVFALAWMCIDYMAGALMSLPLKSNYLFISNSHNLRWKKGATSNDIIIFRTCSNVNWENWDWGALSYTFLSFHGSTYFNI